MKLHRKLIAGSALELVVAVPSHIIVRNRGDCCGGFLTGTGICIGVVVAFISFGPSVLLAVLPQIQADPNPGVQSPIGD